MPDPAERLQILNEIDAYLAATKTWEDLFCCGAEDPGAGAILEVLLRIFEPLAEAPPDLWVFSETVSILIDRCRRFLNSDFEYEWAEKRGSLAQRWRELIDEPWPFRSVEQMSRASQRCRNVGSHFGILPAVIR